MKTHVFIDAVNILAPGSDPGARFYAWCWLTHFPKVSSLSKDVLFPVINKQLEPYQATFSDRREASELIITFTHEDDLTRFLLTWS